MIMNYYGQLDITKLNEIINAHPEAFKRVTFKDGKEHILLNIDVRDKQQTDAHGNCAYIKASIKNPKEGVSVFLADLKVSQYQQQQTQPFGMAQPTAPAPPAPPAPKTDLFG